MILNCVIIDDEPIARKLLQEYIEETDFLKLLGTAENPLKAITLLSQQEADLIFLDVNMPKMNGLDFLKSSSSLPMVIMTTAYAQYALEGFEMAVVDYLVKPFSLDRFLKAVRKALELKTLRSKAPIAAKSGEDHFFVKCEGKIEKVLYDELIYVESMANYITLHTSRRKMVVYLTLKGIQEQLPPDRFIQVHKSYLVNIEKVDSIEGNILHVGSVGIMVGSSFTDAVMGRILKNTFIRRGGV